VTSRTVKDLSNNALSTETFTYDLAGNITDAPDSCFAYDTNNRLITFNGQSVEYDCDGNMLSNGITDFGYDSQNRLVFAGDHDYTYNAENVRIRNLCEDEDTSYVYNTNCKLSQLLMKTTNNVVTKYVYGLGLIGEETNNVFKTYHFDSRGSTIAITDINGNVTDTFAYDTYGKQISHVGTSDIIFGYNGRDGVVTDNNGLIYMRARYYSPDMRRFINADTTDVLEDAMYDINGMNLYVYCDNNPVMDRDDGGDKGGICDFRLNFGVKSAHSRK
jgi:RHS repeat-associated protein